MNGLQPDLQYTMELISASYEVTFCFNYPCCFTQFADIQGSLEAAPSTRSDDTSEGHPAKGSPLTLSPEASGGLAPQAEASQGSLGKAPGDEQKKKSKREWQQSLRSSNKFKSADASRGPWGLSAHSPKTERRSAQLLYAGMPACYAVVAHA